MLITKDEPEAICQRHAVFLRKIRPEFPIEVKTSTSYVYNWIPGSQPTNIDAVYRYLRSKVWGHSPIEGDWNPLQQQAYVTYIRYIRPTVPALILREIGRLTEIGNPCLVHGDATLENFLVVEDGGESKVVPIDPGHPRGFVHPNNDKGKLLQSYLTHWRTLKEGVEPVEFYNPFMLVTTASVISLLTHWYRLVRHHERHRPAVLRHGCETVIPELERAILARLEEGEDSLSSGSGWNVDQLEELYNRLLPSGF